MPRPVAAAVAATAAEAVRRVPGVVDLDAGPLGTKVTYGTSGRVAGVTVREGDGTRTVALHLRVTWGPVQSVARSAVDAALAALASAYPHDGPWRVDVEVADIELAETAGVEIVGEGAIG